VARVWWSAQTTPPGLPNIQFDVLSGCADFYHLQHSQLGLAFTTSASSRHPYSLLELIMIYKFKSQAAAEVIMLQANGDQMLSILGKEPTAQGIITVAQIPAAIAALDAAIEVHEAAVAKRREHPELLVEVEGDSVRLRDRAAPFIELLKTSALAGKDVVWGV
jgi:cyclopropane-fatty-acyl-phospholipid synthase